MLFPKKNKSFFHYFSVNYFENLLFVHKYNDYVSSRSDY